MNPFYPVVLSACLLLINATVVGAVISTNQEIVVLATRLDNLDLMDTSVAADTTMITQEQIKRSDAQSIPSLLQKEGNVLVRSFSGSGMDGQISMRGFGDNSHLRVLVLVDGQQANRPDMAGIEWQSIPLSNVQEVEIIRGGQNVLYGNYALGGVIKIKTKRGEDTTPSIKQEFGSNRYVAGAATFAMASDSFDFLMGANGYQTDGFRKNSASRSRNYNTEAGWFITDSSTLTFRLFYTDSYVQFPGPLTYDEMMQDPTQSSNLGDEFSDQQSSQGTLLYEVNPDWGAVRVNFGGRTSYREPELSGLYFHNQIDGLFFEPRIRWGSKERYLLGGIDFRYDALKQKNFYDNTNHRDVLRSWAKMNRFTASPYLFAQKLLTESTTLNGGARFESASTQNKYVEYKDNQLLPNIGPFPNPDYQYPPDVDPAKSYEGDIRKNGWSAEISLQQELLKGWTVWTGYDRVYRYPTLDEVAAYQGYPLSDPLNENLDPETGNNFEVGTRFKSTHWTTAFTAFLLKLDNEIVFDDVQNLNRNMAPTKRLGGEFELGWANDIFGLSSRWTLVQARIDKGADKGSKIPLVPQAYGTVSTWVQVHPICRLSAIYSYVAEQYQGNDDANQWQKMKPYGLLSLQSNFEIGDHLNLLFSVNNLFDKTYASSAYSGGFYPGAGRQFLASLTLEF